MPLLFRVVMILGEMLFQRGNIFRIRLADGPFIERVAIAWIKLVRFGDGRL